MIVAAGASSATSTGAGGGDISGTSIAAEAGTAAAVSTLTDEEATAMLGFFVRNASPTPRKETNIATTTITAVDARFRRRSSWGDHGTARNDPVAPDSDDGDGSVISS